MKVKEFISSTLNLLPEEVIGITFEIKFDTSLEVNDQGPHSIKFSAKRKE